MDELKRVTVKGAGGKTAVARVVSETEDTCYVVGEAEYQQARARGEAVEARLGFPKTDVLDV